MHVDAAPPPVAAPPPAVPPWIAEADARGWTWAGVAWRRAAAVPGAWFDESLADWAVAIWATVFFLTDLRFAGVPFRLALWQEIVVRLLVGWRVPAEVVDPRSGKTIAVQVRLFRRLLLWIPRKNGKSEFLAALGLFFWALDAVHGGQGYCFALTEKQAKIVLAKMKAMVAFNKKLAKKVSLFGKSLWLPERLSRFEVLTGKAEGKHGLSAYVAVGDEMHEWISRDLDTTIRQSMGAQLQPIELFGSTAGLKSARTGYELFTESLAILEGPIAPPSNDNDEGVGLYDPQTLAVIFALDEDADWRDEENWRKVNPNLGLSPTIDFLRREAALAKKSPRAESHFRRYHCNQWVDAVTRWLPMKAWDACAPDKSAWKTMLPEMAGQRCFIGFDLSTRTDIAALAFLFPPAEESGVWRAAFKFWITEAGFAKRDGRDRSLFDRWKLMGAFEIVPGDMIDQEIMRAELRAAVETFDVAQIGFDEWNAAKLYTDLCGDGLGEDLFTKVPQSIAVLTEPSKKLEDLVLTFKLDHGGHPVLRWMAENVMVISDTNANFRPSKKHSREKIDGISALNCALKVALSSEPQEKSFWDS